MPSPNSSPDVLLDLDARAMLDSLPDGAYVTDRNRKIVFWNHAAERITGWKAEEVVNHTCFDNILCHVDKDGHCLCGDDHCPLRRSILTGTGTKEALLVYAQTKDGKRTPVEISVAPIRNRTGEIIGGIETFRDLADAMQNQLQAQKLQKLVLKCNLPTDRRVGFDFKYQPRDLIGGDFYRIEPFGANYYAILLADVVGHGVSAALCTMLLRSTWDDHRGSLPTPKKFMRIVNQSARYLSQNAGYFGTAVSAVYDASTGEFRCVRAGHPAPLLFRAGGAVEKIGGVNAAVGMFEDTQYEETVVQLAPGDTLLIYSDGATELTDTGENDLGTAGLLRLVREQLAGAPPAQLRLDKLEEQLLSYSGQIRLPDDLTLIKLTRGESAERI